MVLHKRNDELASLLTQGGELAHMYFWIFGDSNPFLQKNNNRADEHDHMEEEMPLYL